jgi:hypothetical protein
VAFDWFLYEVVGYGESCVISSCRIASLVWLRGCF